MTPLLQIIRVPNDPIRWRALRGIATLAVACACVGSAQAQSSGQDFPGGPSGPGGGAIPGMPGHAGHRSGSQSKDSGEAPSAPSDTERFGPRLDALHTALALNASQGPAWDRFSLEAEKVKTDIERPRGRTVSILQAHAPQLIEQTLDGPRDAVTALEDVAASAEALYRVLTPPQQEVADRELSSFIRFLAGAELRAHDPGLGRDGSR